MQPLISLLIAVLIFGIVAYGLYWVCVKFTLPQPVMWICGAILLLIILYFISGQVGMGSNFQLLPQRR